MRPTATVWTERRKWIGNLLPILFWLPCTAAGVGWMILAGELVPGGLYLLAWGTVLGWLALNQFGFFQNGKMRRQLERVLRDREQSPPADRHFVGFASPRYTGLLDAHEDVGFFWLLPDRAVFQSETRRIEMYKAQVTGVRFRPNVHTLVGLGRWVSIEGTSDGKPIRLMIEPRDRQTLFGNLRRGRALREEIRRWAQAKS